MTKRKSRHLPTGRLSFGPLATICERRWRANSEEADQLATPITKVAALVGADRMTVGTWSRDGLTFRAADRAAVALNLHPGNIWPDWWEIAA